MRYPIEPRDRSYLKDYGFLSFANWSKEDICHRCC